LFNELTKTSSLDPAGNVYVDNLFTNVVTEFAAATIAGASLGTTGAVMRTLNNNSTGVPGSAGMAIGP
jgi:ABC-type cobalamin transport system permease subunit